MATTRMTMPLRSNFGGNGHSLSSGSATNAAVDAYATRVLRSNSPPEACVDDSLGPYVTSLLRTSLSCLDDGDNCYGNKNNNSNNETLDVTTIPDHESMVELLEEHCILDEVSAKNVLQTIAIAVRTGVIENTSYYDSNRRKMSSNDESKSDYGGGRGGGTSSYSAWDSSNNNYGGLGNSWTMTGSVAASPGNTANNGTPDSKYYNGWKSPINAGGGVSGSSPNKFIPVDLMGVLDDPSTPKPFKHPSSDITALTDVSSSSSCFTSPSMNNDTTATSNINQSKPSPQLRPAAQPFEFKMSATNNTSNNSINYDSNNSTEQPLPSPAGAAHQHYYNEQQQDNHQQYYSTMPCDEIDEGEVFQQQLDETMEMLLSMNNELGEEAAYEAALVANADFHIAQALVDGAMSAPPFCRHLLNDSCYRSDCQFSHDYNNHTCMFWLKGWCKEGYEQCRFLHGFSTKLLEGIDIDDIKTQHQQHYSNQNGGALQRHYGVDDSDAYNNNTLGDFSSSQQQQQVQYHHDVVGSPSLSSSTTSSTKPVPIIETTNLVQHNRTNNSSSYNAHNVNNNISYSAPQLLSNDSSTSTLNGNGGTSTGNSYSLDSSFAYNQQPSQSTLGAYKGQVWEPSKTNTSISSNNGTSNASSFSFASIASKGYSKDSFVSSLDTGCGSSPASSSPLSDTKFVKIPQDLWNSNENRDASAFRIPDPIERYRHVSLSVKRDDVIDLHFQSTKTFQSVLSLVLSEKLRDHGEVWIVTGSGHHVGTKTQQKSGGSLENAVTSWLTTEGYMFVRGKDRNGYSGATLVKR